MSSVVNRSEEYWNSESESAAAAHSDQSAQVGANLNGMHPEPMAEGQSMAVEMQPQGAAVLQPVDYAYRQFEGAQEQPHGQIGGWLLGLGAAAIALGGWYFLQQPPEAIYRPRTGVARFLPMAEALSKPQRRAIAPSAPAGWREVPVAGGGTTYVPSSQDRLQVDVGVPSQARIAAGADRTGADAGTTGAAATNAPLDGTRHPYVDDVSFRDLIQNQVAPGQYEWTGIWRGEGYDRELEREERLVAWREGGADIHLTVRMDTRITDPNQPNLFVTVQSDQDENNQLTNLSAFRYDSATGAMLDRKDFGQLLPFYDVTVRRNGGFAGTETKTLVPLGTTSFAYHVSPKDLASNFFLELRGVNQFYNQRLMEIYDLESQGWIVKEVPPPDAAAE